MNEVRDIYTEEGFDFFNQLQQSIKKRDIWLGKSEPRRNDRSDLEDTRITGGESFITELGSTIPMKRDNQQNLTQDNSGLPYKWYGHKFNINIQVNAIYGDFIYPSPDQRSAIHSFIHSKHPQLRDI